eukprot:Skav221086  [mRNA]  locus=scaffold1024:4510:7362:+ [translate_table: standard]
MHTCRCFSIPQVHMPPFSDEPEEKQCDKPLSFLSFRNVAKPAANLRPRSIFGAEPAESQPEPPPDLKHVKARSSSAKSKSVPKRPFEDESVEHSPPKVSRGSVFGDEGEEDESGCVSGCQPATSQLFAPEGSEDEHAPSGNEASSGAKKICFKQFAGAKELTAFLDQFVRRGRASKRKQDLDDNSPSDWEEIGSDLENSEELREWLTTQNCKTTLLPHNQLVRKYLPPGTVMDLYEHYKSTQAMLGCHCVSRFGLDEQVCDG